MSKIDFSQLKQFNWRNPIHKTFALHLIYSILTGFLDGSFYLNEFVLIKSLKGSNYQIALLFQFSIVVLIFSVITNELIKRFRNKKRMIQVLALVTNVPLLFFLFFPSVNTVYDNPLLYQMFFLGIFLVHYSTRPILFPSITSMLKKSYGQGRFGKLFGYATTFNKTAIMVATFTFGVLLDIDPFVFIWVYPTIGVLGLVAVMALSWVPNIEEAIAVKKPLWESVSTSIKEMWRVITKNKAFRDFEGGFMLYGIAWMITMAVITIFFERELHLNYTSIAVYKNAYNILSIAILPFFSKLIDKIDPRKFGIITFVALLLHLFTLSLTEFFPQHIFLWGVKIYYMLVLSYIFYAVFASTMGLLWFIGSAYFCKDDEVSHYQSVHLSMVGLRALIAPLVGIFFLEYLGFFGVFSLGVLFLAMAVILMLWSMHKRPKVD